MMEKIFAFIAPPEPQKVPGLCHFNPRQLFRSVCLHQLYQIIACRFAVHNIIAIFLRHSEITVVLLWVKGCSYV